MRSFTTSLCAVVIGLVVVTATQAGGKGSKSSGSYSKMSSSSYKMNSSSHYNSCYKGYCYDYGCKFWSNCCWNSSYGCNTYWCPTTCCNYYYCQPDCCYYPVTYCPYGTYC